MLFRSGNLGRGGGIFNVNGTSTLINCTIAGNESANGEGAGVYSHNGTVVFRNCIVVDNTITSTGASSDIFKNSDSAIIRGNYTLSTYKSWDDGSNNKVYKNEKIFDSTSSRAYTPYFNSLTIDTGANSYNGRNNDLAGSARVNGGTIDMGCYEFEHINCTFESRTVPYNGANQSLVLSGTKSTDTVTYTYNGATISSPTFQNAGTYTVKATVSRSGETKSYTATLTIKNGVIPGIVFKSETVVYDGTSHTLHPTGILPTDSTTFTYNGESFSSCPAFTNAGSYTVKFTVSRPNYEDWVGYATLTIDKAPLEDISFPSQVFVHDGDFHILPIYGVLPSDTVVYSHNDENSPSCPAFAEPGSYIITATVSRPNYLNWEGDAKLTIMLDSPTIATGRREVYVSYGANRHQIKWNAVQNAKSYELEYSIDGGESWKSITTTETSAVVTGLEYGANVKYQVRALGIDAEETSEWSVAKSFIVCPMDINGDGDISSPDRTLLANSWLAEEGDDKYSYYTDIDGNGDISNSDRTYLLQNWTFGSDDADLVFPKPKAADRVFADFASADFTDLDWF